MRAVLPLSGGVDSTVLAHYLAQRQSQRVHAVTFRYGQRHADREIAAAARTAKRLCLLHTVIDLHPAIFAETALTGFGEVPWLPTSDVKGTAPVVVPGRNTVFLTCAAAVAAREGISTVYFAAHMGDAASFPDARPGYLAALNSLLKVADMGVEVIGPFMRRTKTEIVQMGAEMGVKWEDSYSCYQGGPEHCGKCGACQGRIEAFAAAGVEDTAAHRYGTVR